MRHELCSYGWQHAGAHCHHDYVLPAIKALLPSKPGLQILDLGCGSGFTAAHLAACGHRVIGIDPAEDGIALARERWPAVRFEVASGYDDLSALMPDGGWEVIVASEVIEHLYSPQAFLTNTRRHLRPEGVLILTTPYHGYLKNLALAALGQWDRHLTVHWENGHIKFFSVRTLSTMLLATGFTDIEFRFVGRLPYLWKGMICRARRGP
jgi:2-polyprenyl-3-methyl-5-hydroxy-6-metoxy-1,4-benzoquinol methylase